MKYFLSHLLILPSKYTASYLEIYIDQDNAKVSPPPKKNYNHICLYVPLNYGSILCIFE